MSFLKRIFLFGIVNILVIVTLTIVLEILQAVLGFRFHTGSLMGLMVIAALWGMGGSFISLMISKYMAKWMMGVRVIDPRKATHYEQELLQRVYRMAKAAGLKKMPEVGIYSSPELNAFATGPSKNDSLVAVSSGLLDHMNDAEVDGVLGHEISHIANGDMVTMTLIQGVINAFVIFFARIVASLLTSFLRGDDEEGGGLDWIAQFMLTIVLEIAFGTLGMIVVAYFSRIREFRADAGGAKVAGREKMIAALTALQKGYGNMEQSSGRDSAIASLKISNKGTGLAALFSTHPPLEERIRRLQRGI